MGSGDRVGGRRQEIESSGWESDESLISCLKWLLGLLGLLWHLGVLWVLGVLREAIVSVLMQLDTLWFWRADSRFRSWPLRIVALAMFNSPSAHLMS